MQPWPPVPTKTTEFYKQGWFTVLTLFFRFPIGFVLMWMYQQKWHIAVKGVISGLLALFFIAVIVGSNSSSSTPTSPSPQVPKVVSVPLTPAQKRQAAKVAKEQAAKANIAAQHQKEADAEAAAQAKRQDEEDARKQAAEAQQQQEAQRQQDQYNATYYTSNGLTLDRKSVHWDEDDSGIASYITGKVTNDTGEDLDYAEITYKEMDGDGNQVGTAMDNITHLSAGATWKFKCLLAEDSTKHIELDDMKTTAF